jgi:hypothetical protein
MTTPACGAGAPPLPPLAAGVLGRDSTLASGMRAAGVAMLVMLAGGGDVTAGVCVAGCEPLQPSALHARNQLI